MPVPPSVSMTLLACNSTGDAARLAAALSAAGAFDGTGPPPDLIFANNAQVELSWLAASVAHTHPASAFSRAGGASAFGAVSLSHRQVATTTVKVLG